MKTTVEIVYNLVVVRIVLCYGPQEDVNVEVRSKFYEDLCIEIRNGKLNDAIPVILGEFNAKLSYSDQIIHADYSNGKQPKEGITYLHFSLKKQKVIT